MKVKNLISLILLTLGTLAISQAGFTGPGPEVIDAAGGTVSSGTTEVQISTGQSGGAGILTAGNVTLEVGFLHAYTAAVQSDFSVSPGSLNFGVAISGESLPSPQSITLANNGTGQVVFTGNGIEIIGTDTDSFSFVVAPDTSPLAAGATRAVEVQFDPPSVGVKSASVRITTDDPDAATVDVTLGGSRVDPTATPTATPTDTATSTATPTTIDTATSTPTDTPTSTPIDTVPPTSAYTATPTATETATDTVTPTATNTPTATPTEDATATVTPTGEATETATETPQETVSPTATPTVDLTATVTPTGEVTETATPTVTETPVDTQSPTVTPTATETEVPTATFTPDPAEYFVFLTAPAEGSIVSGTQVMVAAQLSESVVAQTDRVLFQKNTGSGSWTDLTNLSVGSNPDSTTPYFVNWDTSGEAEGSLWLRAVSVNDVGGFVPSRQIIVEVEYGEARSVTTRNDIGNVVNQTLLDPTRPAQAQLGEPEINMAVTADIPVGMATEEVTLSIEMVPTEQIDQLQPNDEPGAVIGLRVSLSNGQHILNQPLRLVVSYPDVDNDGLIDTNGVMELTAKIAYIDAFGNLEYLTDQVVDPVNNVISGYTSHLSNFVMLGQVPTPTPTSTATATATETPVIPTPTPTMTPTMTPVPTVGISISPTTATVRPGQAIKLDVTVTGTSDQSLYWWVAGIPWGNESVGTVTADGWYTPPLTQLPFENPVTVMAQSQADTSKTATAQITVAPLVEVSPARASIFAGQTQAFSVQADLIAPENFTWRVNGIEGGNAEVGTIDSDGLYQAPSEVRIPKGVRIEALDTLYSRYLGTAYLMVRPIPQLFILDGQGQVQTLSEPMPEPTP